MKMSIGKLRGLHQIADDRGFLTICAIDHRGALQQAMNAKSPEQVTYKDMVDFKLDLCRAVTPFVSAVLLDPVYGAAEAVASGTLSGHVGLLVSLEKSGYSGDKAARVTEILSGWSVDKIKRMGASAVKILVYFRPDLKEVAARQLDLLSIVADQCASADIPLLVEPVSYPTGMDGESAAQFAAKKPGLVIETARMITALPIDVLKAEFPADMKLHQDDANLHRLCRELDGASRLPWVLLSAGADFETFRRQVEIACKAGASGFLAGRALWQEGVQIRSRQERKLFFRDTAASRLKELGEIVRRNGRPWYAKMNGGTGEFNIAGEGWHERY